MSQKRNTQNPEPKIGKTVWEDIRRGGFRKSMKEEYEELKEFFLTDERKERLKSMGRIKKWFFISYWLLKTLILRLSSTRRLLVLLGIFLLFFTVRVQVNNSTGDTSFWHIIGVFILLFVLMLELKDKLLAKSELEAGRTVQRALLPREDPRIPGWDVWLWTQPANEVGGDLVDFLSPAQNRYSVILADISGKGLGAALFAARLQAVIRALAPDYTSLARLVEKLNEIFYRDSLPNRFASLIYVEIEPDSDRLKLVNAGHFPPLKIKNSHIKELSKGGAALGIRKKENYKEEEITLGPEEVLVIYSDGLTETRNSTGEFYDEIRLMEVLRTCAGRPAREIGKMLIQAVEEFRGDARAFDDLSLIIIKNVSAVSS